MIRLSDGRLALPYGGHAETHNAGFFEGFYTNYSSTTAFGWAIWDDARLAGIQADRKSVV